LGLNAVGILFVRLVDFVLDSFIYAGVRGLPVLVICPPGLSGINSEYLAGMRRNLHKKELVDLPNGVRESTRSWNELLLDLKRRGLSMGPELAFSKRYGHTRAASADGFIETWGVKYDRATECLIKDRDALLAFYDFPAEHWKHLRTTNVIESSFATVRHRIMRSKGCLSKDRAGDDLQAR
jgi:hypothetical protein